MPTHFAGQSRDLGLHTPSVSDDQVPICPACGVTMVPAVLAAERNLAEDWICLECEETGEPASDR
jgi:hypothetical protein